MQKVISIMMNTSERRGMTQVFEHESLIPYLSDGYKVIKIDSVITESQKYSDAIITFVLEKENP